jgi:hypothetical protein
MATETILRVRCTCDRHLLDVLCLPDPDIDPVPREVVARCFACDDETFPAAVPAGHRPFFDAAPGCRTGAREVMRDRTPVRYRITVSAA